MTSKRKPGIVALAVIVVVSIALGGVFSPADPLSFIFMSTALLMLSVGSYFAGYRRG